MQSNGNVLNWGIRSVLLVAALSLGACATKPDPKDQAALQAYEEANDPIEPLNRYFFELNRFFDTILLKPVATWYQGVLPRPARNGVRNFFDNLRSPVILGNDLLQGEWERAGTTTKRFGINSTIGVLGLFDPAEKWGMPQHGEDFGQTLGTWGVSEGPYLYLPILGPTPPRDLVGFGVDQLMDPLTWIVETPPYTIPVTRFVLNGVDLRARNLDTLDNIERTSVDYYATMRSLYRQLRRNEIANGKLNSDELPDIDNLNLDTNGTETSAPN